MNKEQSQPDEMYLCEVIQDVDKPKVIKRFLTEPYFLDSRKKKYNTSTTRLRYTLLKVD